MMTSISCNTYEQKSRRIFVDKAQNFTSITLGDSSYIVQAFLETGNLKCHVLIGKYCSISHRVKFIIGLDHDSTLVSTYPFNQTFDEKWNSMTRDNHSPYRNQIIIGNDVWIGADVTILGGVKIGNGAVIGAGAVVSRDIPPYAIAVGNPAKVVKYRFDKETIDWLQQLRWWNWAPDKIRLRCRDMGDIRAFRLKYENLPSHQKIGNKDLLQSIQQLKDKGYIFYYLRPDYSSVEAIWKNAVDNFENKNIVDGMNVLFIDIQPTIQQEDLDKISGYIAGVHDANIIVRHQDDSILDLMDYIITTKEAESSYLVDAVSQSDCRIIYGNDDWQLCI